MAEMTESEKKIVKKWQPIFEKCGNLTTDEQKTFLANTLEALHQKAANSGANDRTLALGDTLNVVDPSETHRLVISYDGDGNFNVIPQHKDWVNNIS